MTPKMVCHQAFINGTNILMHHHFMSSQYNSIGDEATVGMQDPQMSCRDFITMQGTWIIAPAMATHYNDVIMCAMASQITILMTAYSTVFFSSADQRKHLNSVSLVFVRGIHRWPVNSPHKWPVTRQMFPFDDVIMQTPRITIRVLDMHFKFQAIWPTHTVFVSVYPVMAHFEEESLYIEAWKACQHWFVSSFLCLFATETFQNVMNWNTLQESLILSIEDRRDNTISTSTNWSMTNVR